MDTLWIVDPDDKREQLKKAFNADSKTWKAHVETLLDVYAVASPAPLGSTGTLASQISLQARFTEARATQIREWVEWIQTNYST